MYDLRSLTSLLVLLSLPILLGAGPQARPQARPQADSPQRFIVQPESRFWISGSSTVNRFTCETDEVVGYGLVQEAPSSPVRTVQYGGTEPGLAHISVPVQAFDCGNRRMNRDMHDALKAEAHPVIQYELLQACVLPLGEGGWHPVEVRGRLTIAGVERMVKTMVQGRTQPDGRVRATGAMDLQMTDFGIEPPTAMLGVVKAHNDITVHFELVAAAAAAP